MKKGEDYPGVTISFFCHDGNGEYVLSKRSENCRDEHGRWDFGGGSLDLHDTVEETLRKEIAEELCTNIVSYEFLGYSDVHRENDGVRTHWISLEFKVEVDRSNVRNGEPHKFDEIGWFKLDSLPEPLHSQGLKEVERYRDRL
ncbi:MAG: NUDIX domain-containing protein [Patescibacteria group bacterium]